MNELKRLWQREYTLRADDFDKYNRIKPSAVLNLFQDAAGRHALELGLGFEDMLERSLLWALTRVKFKIIGQPKSYQDVIIKTWPLEPSRFNYRREYCIEDLDGERLIVGSSEWVVIHSEKRRLVSVPDLYPFKEGFHNEKMLEDKLSKVSDFEASGNPHTVNAGFSDLDVNDHVNNTKYANYILDAVSPERQDVIEEFQLDYRKEVMLGTQLNIYNMCTEDGVRAKGQNTEGDIMFACNIKFK